MAPLRAIALVASVLVLSVASEVSPPDATDHLAGSTWHTVRIDGDSLFFFVKEGGVRFEDNSRFAAAVRFIDGQ